MHSLKTSPDVLHVVPDSSPIEMGTTAKMAGSGTRADGTAVTCAQMFQDTSTIAKFNLSYSTFYAASVEIPVGAVGLSQLLCGDQPVPATGLASSSQALKRSSQALKWAAAAGGFYLIPQSLCQ